MWSSCLLLLSSILCHHQAESLNLAWPRPCGVGLQRARSTRVIGGKPAFRGQFPWTVSLRRLKRSQGGDKDEFIHFCAGALVTDRHIVTAAHCVHNYKQQIFKYQVVAGEWKPKIRDAGEQIRQIEGITLHPQYDYPNSRYDIALITLAESITWSDQVSPVCLPEGSPLYTGLNATLVGWGYQEKLMFQQKYKSQVSEVLMQARVPVLSNERCQSWFNQKSPLEIEIDDSSLCAGYEDGRHDGCKGDSGGPLTTRIDGLSVLIGVVSIGLGCGQPKLPGLYSRVAQITPWIQSETR